MARRVLDGRIVVAAGGLCGDVQDALADVAQLQLAVQVGAGAAAVAEQLGR